ncbi:uncharacterized protein LOC133718115 isoform X1 [Rosa rugosa]|uniref:uncharacterized protein LOC133718115 isoform X1 n=1 Tax=Rosa rugosa TaxID=74645 RepID=UPI002B405E93|nr:uncharacterized protein LOC133718115 isoform X1 [Rosa rugosa]
MAIDRASSGLQYPERFYVAASYAGFDGSPRSSSKAVRAKFNSESALILYALYKQSGTQHLDLNFSGINYYAEVYLNGHKKVLPRGMFRRHSLDVTDIVHDSENMLAVVVYPRSLWLCFILFNALMGGCPN